MSGINFRISGNRDDFTSRDFAEALVQQDRRDGELFNVFSNEAREANPELGLAYFTYVAARDTQFGDMAADRLMQEVLTTDERDDADINMSPLNAPRGGDISQLFMMLVRAILGIEQPETSRGRRNYELTPGRTPAELFGPSRPAPTRSASISRPGSSALQNYSLNSMNPTGNRLGDAAAEYANSGQARPHTCAGSVSQILRDTMGINTHGHAYQLADQLAQSDQLVEIRVPRSEIPNLPSGAIVCWDRTQGSGHWTDTYGHVSISLGDGREASWCERDQLILNSNARVFVPRDSILAQQYA